MALQTRKPTGAVPWPLVLVEGEEKAGKTWACAILTASDKVGRCFWIDLGEGAADEYGAIPGTDYEIVEHDGSFAALYANVAEIRDIAAKALEAGEKPVVLIIDTMTDEWDILKDWATDRAKSSRANREKLARDPNAEIKVSQNYWNDANARHRKLMWLLKRFPGIVLMTSHGKQVSVQDEATGQPVEGKKEHKVEANKTLGADATCWIRLFREKPGIIVGGRSAHLQFRPGSEAPKPLASDWTLERIIFDVLKCDPATAHVRDLQDRTPDAVTPEQIRDKALAPKTSIEQVRDLFREAKRLGYDDVIVINEREAEELLLHLLSRVGNEKQQAEQRAAADQAAQAWQQALKAVDPDDSWLQPISEASDLGTLDQLRTEFAETYANKPDDDPRKKALTVLLDLKQAELKRRSAPAPAAQAQGTGTQTASASAPGTADDFAANLRKKLEDANANAPDAFTALRGEIGEALAKQVIPPRMASELHQEVAAKFRTRRAA